MAVKRSLLVILSLLCLICVQPIRVSAGSEDYGIGDLTSTSMSYRHDGAYSPFKYVQVKVQGNGKAICSVGHFDQSDQTEEFDLDPNFIKDLVKIYADLDFFNYNFSKITDSSDENHAINDVGTTTFTYQYKDKVRGISYQSVRTRVRDHTAIPINADAKKLVDLQTMYWKVLNRKIYMDNLKNYKNLDKGVLANELSSLGSCAERGELLNSREFVPLIMEIISQQELRDSIGQYAASALEQLTGEKPAGDWWDCERWIKWRDNQKSAYEKN